MTRGKLGVLGGMGPQATQMFYQRVLDLTDAHADQEHIPTLILSDTQMPDRTAAIVSGETRAVADRLLADAHLLEEWGAAAIAIPCNTSHTFVPALQAQLRTPIVNMITETAAELKALGTKRVGILATDGTLRMRLYHAACEAEGMEAVSPPGEIQRLVMSIIYDEIKKGEKGSPEKFSAIDAALRTLDCDRAVLACTELSVYKDWHGLPGFYLDAMDVLARQSVLACGYSLRMM
ncbi:MAG: amino acid racemase [Pseudoflavonifractor sp.]|nr:amino acid racemase [Pseudoflavonifractor sp.]